jgi:hypothetical protein
MAVITIKDLPANRLLDRKAMASIRGSGAPWVYGWIQPYVSGKSSTAPVFNFIEVNNTFNADQMINQFQSIDIRNAAPNASIDVALDGNAANAKAK